MKSNNALVSILTPCYNGESHIARLLESILYQSYNNIEMYVVDDGSIDNTASIVKSYVTKFKSKGYSLNYVFQANSGQGSAINNGLKFVKGDYLVWPDSDDFFATNKSIEKMVVSLEKEENKNNIARTFCNVLDEENLKPFSVLGGEKFKKNRREDLFEDCLFDSNGFWFGAGNYIIRMNELLKYYPNREIYPSTKFGGQNWQLLLPLLFNKTCITIEEKLYNVVARKFSHSRGTFVSLENLMKKYDEHERIIKNVLDVIYDLGHTSKEKYITAIEKKYFLIKVRKLAEYNKIAQTWRCFFNNFKKHNFSIKEYLILSFELLPFVLYLKKQTKNYIKTIVNGYF